MFILSKHWEPMLTQSQEEGYNNISQLVTFICQILDIISISKSTTVDAQNQGTWMLLTSLYYLGTRFGGIMKDQIKAKLKGIKKQFEKISKKIIIENEVRVI